MEEEQERKQPCKTCGPTGWNPQQTRRDLFKNAAIVGVGLTAAVMFETAPTSAFASGGLCEELYQACLRVNCGELEGYRKRLCRLQCAAEKTLCSVQELLGKIGDAINQALQWLANHPQVLGAIIVIAGISFVVVACGATAGVGCVGALSLSFA